MSLQRWQGVPALEKGVATVQVYIYIAEGGCKYVI